MAACETGQEDWVHHNRTRVATKQDRMAATLGRAGLAARQVPHHPTKKKLPGEPRALDQEPQKFGQQVKTAIQHLIKPMTTATETSDTSSIKQTEISCGPLGSLIALSP